MRSVLPFVLCGGAGTRLWPLSRDAFPKQFHCIGTSNTLFQETCLKLRGAPFGETTILANRKHRFLIAEQLEAIGIEPAYIVLEREARNTAPAACVAALMAMRQDPDALILLAPSDHLIADAEAFRAAIIGGVEAAEAGKLVLFGVTPNHAHTGYGLAIPRKAMVRFYFNVEFLGENQSTYIAIGKKHRLANPGAEPALPIEVQPGAYLGEDDIVRFEDAYGRGADE